MRETAFADGLMLAQVDGPVGTVVFNQPAKHNAVTVEMWIGLGEIIAMMEADPAIRVIVLRGAGEKAFVSGADIGQFDKTRHNAEVAALHAARMAAGRKRSGVAPSRPSRPSAAIVSAVACALRCRPTFALRRPISVWHSGGAARHRL